MPTAFSLPTTPLLHFVSLRGAGTDANVFIEMHGDKGSMGETRLDNAHDNFERNMKDVFTIKASDLGEIQTIIIRHDNSGIGGAWHLQQVRRDVRAALSQLAMPCYHSSQCRSM